MTSAPDLSGAIDQLLYQQSGYWLAVGGATLLIYDWILCLDREVLYICKARWSLAKVWFICHRYAMMALAVAMAYGSVKTSSGASSPEWCKAWDRVSFAGTIAIVAAMQGTFALRVCALYHNYPYIIAFIGATYLAYTVAMLVLALKLQETLSYFPNPFTSHYFCVRTCNDCIRWSAALYVLVLVIDIVLLALTVRQSFVARTQRKTAPILTTFFQDGIKYFTVAFATGLAHTLFLVFGKGPMRMWMIHYARPLLSSMATRLLLNLHEQVSRTSHYSTGPHENGTNALSTVEFAHLAGAKDAENATHNANDAGSATNDKGRTRGGGSEGGGLELKAIGEADRDELGRGPGWVESEGRLAVPERGQCGPTNVDPG